MRLPTIKPPAVVPAHELDGEVYHRLPGASKSLLDAVARSPAHCAYAMSDHDKPQTPAMLLGSATHCMVLEPAAFTSRYVEKPPRLSAKARAEYVEQGLTPISSEQLAAAYAMSGAVLNHPIAGVLFEDIQPEVSGFWIDSETGVTCRIRMDAVSAGHHAIIDLKTAADASADGFARACANFRYHVAAAMYLEGAAQLANAALMQPVAHYIFVVVETTAPFAVASYTLDDDAMSIGYKLFRRDLATFAACDASNQWPAYPPEVRPLSLPAWARIIKES